MVWNSIRVPVFILGCFIAAGLTKTQHVEFVDMAVFWDCIGDLAGPGEVHMYALLVSSKYTF